MRSVGIDLAVQPRRTGVARIEWCDDGAAAPTTWAGTATTWIGADDDMLRALLRDSGTDVAGLDVPLGWPRRFVQALAAHDDRRPIEGDSWEELYTATRLRATDRWLRDVCGANPMSVSTNLIAAPALRAAWLLSDAEAAGVPVDRSGVSGRVVEVYPAAALRIWGLPHAGYKKPGAAATGLRRRIRDEVLDRTAVTPVGDVATDHELDALVCAIVARLARTGRTRPIPAELVDLAQREGWIHVPIGPLERN